MKNRLNMERNEAIGRLRQLYSDTNAENKAALECLIPELAESEDERIRKEIIDFINYYRHNTDLTTEQAKWCKEALDWLKKQNERDVKVISWREPDDCADIPEGHLVVIAYKYGVFGLGYVAGGKVICHPDMEQKPWAILYIPNANEQVIIEQKEKQKENSHRFLEIPAENVAPAEGEGPFEEDEFLKGELYAFLQNYDKEYDDDAAVSDVAKHFYEIGKKRKESTSNIELIQRAWYMEGYFDGEYKKEPMWIIKTGPGGPKYKKNERYGQLLPDPKPVEWSEEDEEMYARVVRRYTDYEGVIMRTKEESVAAKMLDAMAQEEIWLKSLLERFNLQPKQEWSEEDEQTINMAIEVLEYDNYPILAKKLKSLRSRPKSSDNWKPSEEQMEALKDLPRWKKADRDWDAGSIDFAVFHRNDGGDHEDWFSVEVTNRLYKGEYYIELSDLEKLPKGE